MPGTPPAARAARPEDHAIRLRAGHGYSHEGRAACRFGPLWTNIGSCFAGLPFLLAADCRGLGRPDDEPDRHSVTNHLIETTEGLTTSYRRERTVRNFRTARKAGR